MPALNIQAYGFVGLSICTVTSPTLLVISGIMCYCHDPYASTALVAGCAMVAPCLYAWMFIYWLLATSSPPPKGRISFYCCMHLA